ASDVYKRQLVGCALLLVALVASGMLAAKRLGGSLPGCGPESPCESLDRTAWGRVPGLGWPVAFLGAAWFAALLGGWLVSLGRVSRLPRLAVACGAVLSLLYIGVMLAHRQICPYCLTAHLANLSFAALLGFFQPGGASEASAAASGSARHSPRHPEKRGEIMRRSSTARVAAVATAAFVLVSAGLGIADSRAQKGRDVVAEKERSASAKAVMEQAAAGGPGSVDRWGAEGFTGRFRRGPEMSPIRVVMLTDYQCPDCKKMEEEMERILSSRRDVSLSIKHFPMCKEAAPGVPCNKYAQRTMHPNACWAARAAEAAGILGGPDGFWKMHHWLFAKSGSFNDAELKAAVAEMGLEPASFTAVMSSPETLRRVQADIEDGFALGLHYTPMIFINGIEMKGFNQPAALRRTIEEVAASGPPARSAAADRPALASEKYVEDWRSQSARPMPPDTRSWSMGAPQGNPSSIVSVVVFGDYQEPYTAAFDRDLRETMRGMKNVRYTFRHFPIDKECNPTLPQNVRPEAIHPQACRMAKAAEAAGRLGGNDAYWKMHEWLFANQSDFGDAALRDAARKAGLDPDRLFATMDDPDVAQAIVEDAKAAQRLGLTGVPMVFVNDKWVPRTNREGENVIQEILVAAGAK
ncbi:MAG: DsbA family protein, partial [Candidatus Eisenbacteria bacterium]|nr:DsbA family protein [Candidatus Eisenbacteria bacterium]